MKNTLIFLSDSMAAGHSQADLLGALVVLGIIAAFLVLVTALFVFHRPAGRKRRRNATVKSGVMLCLWISTALVCCLFAVCLSIYLNPEPADSQPSQESQPVPSTQATAPTTEATEAITEPASTETEEPTTEATTEPTLPSFQPITTDANAPANYGIDWDIIVNDKVVDSFLREEPIRLDDPDDYFALPGVATFRGNNHRTGGNYGTADITGDAMETVWRHSIGTLDDWTGCAWTGQPLVVQWDEETRSVMNLYDEKKEKEDLVEVIYATLDGLIHFYDLEDGTETRDPIQIGMSFKGAGALDPRGYPLLYVGSGLYLNEKSPRMYVISLIDGSILYQYGHNDRFIYRAWNAFDSSPLLDAETDTLIWPGENGILYTIKLNTRYDPENGIISVEPDSPVRTRYNSAYFRSGRYLGYEASASVVGEYLYISENSGLFYCVDLNTMELIWVQDTKDDSNASPVFEWTDEGSGCLYTAPSLHWTAENSAGTISIYKLDAETGDILWEYPIDCLTVEGVSGGIQASPILGRDGTDIEGMIIYAVARTSGYNDGFLIALDKESGEMIWQTDTENYSWSSPLAVYTDEGHACIITANASGEVRLVEGATGEVISKLSLGATIEASPVIFNNMMVLGTRAAVFGIKLS